MSCRQLINPQSKLIAPESIKLFAKLPITAALDAPLAPLAALVRASVDPPSNIYGGITFSIVLLVIIYASVSMKKKGSIIFAESLSFKGVDDTSNGSSKLS